VEDAGQLILAIETSCDDTCAAVVAGGREILSNVISSQARFHERYGGVVPEIASRHHLELVNAVVDEALAESGHALGDMEAIAATSRPGLIGALLIALFCLFTYVAWLFLFAILRYILAFEMLSGVLLLAALSLLPANRVRYVPAIMILSAFAMALGTRYANWGRVPFSDDWFGVRGVEQVHRPGTIYILPGAAPLSFLIHIFPADARFIGIGGSFPLTPGDAFGARAVGMIRAAPHLRSLAAAPTDPASIAALHRFGLTIIPGSCRVIRTKRADVESCALN